MYSLLELEKVYQNLKEGLNKYHDFKFDTLIIVATITVATNHICKAINNTGSKNVSSRKYIDRLDNDNIMG
ncbi:hypothetical protein [Staphylococcus equorum]|uniref:hypothetical protein n=1 Tax=Staphylococcus equorum TaxID=246432 RepID=UPI0008063679|nr:hypothetical protein [Staphylococcus equorum]ANQ64140.1 hypothetical protein AVJ22_05440 [Staphylococcus equorum]